MSGCPTCDPKPETPIPAGRVCTVCDRHEAFYQDLQKAYAWVRLPVVRALEKDASDPDRGRPWCCADCWEDITMEMRDDVAVLQNENAHLNEALQASMKLLDLVDDRGRVH